MRAAIAGIIFILLGHSFSYGQRIRRSSVKRNTHLHALKRDRIPFGKKKYATLGITINALNYYGDLSPLPRKMSTDINFTRPGYGLTYTLRKGPRYTLQSQFLVGTIRGNDASSAAKDDVNGIYRMRRNASFKNTIEELSVSAVFDLFDNNSVYTHRPLWTPYVFFGASVFHHNPKGKVPDKDLDGNDLPNRGEWISLRPLGTEGQYADLLPGDANYGIKPYKLFQSSLLFGLGVRYRINEVIDIWADFSCRYTFTDYLDDVSRNYVDLGVFPDKLAQSMSYRNYDSHLSLVNPNVYKGRDGKMYTVESGYGSEHPDNMRGNKNNKDIMMITSVRVSHVIGQKLHRAKRR
jgi:hypothetical protein